jgi:hypothetical protein
MRILVGSLTLSFVLSSACTPKRNDIALGVACRQDSECPASAICASNRCVAAGDVFGVSAIRGDGSNGRIRSGLVVEGSGLATVQKATLTSSERRQSWDLEILQAVGSSLSVLLPSALASDIRAGAGASLVLTLTNGGGETVTRDVSILLGETGPQGPTGAPASCSVTSNSLAAVITCTDGTSATLPRSPRHVSLPVASGPSYEINGGADLSGYPMAGTGFSRVTTGFVIPPDYTPGTDLTVRVVWGNSQSNATSCGFDLWINSVVAYRADFGYIVGSATFAGSGQRTVLMAPATAQQVRSADIIISGSSGGAPLWAAGDSVSLYVARDSVQAADTCTGKLFILGLSVSYP